MKVYACQLDIVWEDKPANYRKVRELIKTARPEPGSLFVLPEMFSTGFSMNVPEVAEENGPGTMGFLRDLAKERKIYIQAGLVTRNAEGKGLNQAVVNTPEGKELVRYTKIHPFTLGGELANYARGTEVKHYEWSGIQVTPFVCYDLRFPVWSRQQTKKSEQATDNQPEFDLLVYVANWPERRIHAWKSLLTARAIENQCFVVGVNRVGTDGNGIDYNGHSAIIGPKGDTIFSVEGVEATKTLELNAHALQAYRDRFPAFLDADDFTIDSEIFEERDFLSGLS